MNDAPEALAALYAWVLAELADAFPDCEVVGQTLDWGFAYSVGVCKPGGKAPRMAWRLEGVVPREFALRKLSPEAQGTAVAEMKEQYRALIDSFVNKP